MDPNPLTWSASMLPDVLQAGLIGLVIAVLSMWAGYRQGFRHGEQMGQFKIIRRVTQIMGSYGLSQEEKDRRMLHLFKVIMKRRKVEP